MWTFTARTAEASPPEAPEMCRAKGFDRIGAVRDMK